MVGIFCDLAKAFSDVNHDILLLLHYLSIQEQWQIGSDPTLQKENKRLK
jgi:hypothetical protein